MSSVKMISGSQRKKWHSNLHDLRVEAKCLCLSTVDGYKKG